MPCIVFLDIDGVIHPRHALSCRSYDASLPGRLSKEKNCPALRWLDAGVVSLVDAHFDRDACARVQRLCQDYDARIVITSSWRASFSLAQLQALFSIVGLGEYVADVTPFGLARSKCIQAWLKEHPASSFVVLDDMDLSKAFGYRFIHCADSFGEQEYRLADQVFRLHV